MNKKPLLFIALDDLDERRQPTIDLATRLARKDGKFGFKVNSDAALNLDMGLREVLAPIQALGRQVFLDLKTFNGRRTIGAVCRKSIELGIQFTNVWAQAENQLSKAIEAAKGSETRILGLTVLTHYDEAYCQRNFRRSFPETVRHFALTAVEYGCNGIILPGTQLHTVQDLETFKVIPGVRPSWYKDDRHSKEAEVTPAQAVAAGADALVCGSPITKWPDPIEALQRILAEY